MAERNDLDRVCAWCKKDMGKKASSETGTTHGICPECLAKIEKEEMAVNEGLPKSMEDKAADGRTLYGSKAANEKRLWAILFTVDGRRLRWSRYAESKEQAESEGLEAVKKEYVEFRDFKVEMI